MRVSAPAVSRGEVLVVLGVGFSLRVDDAKTSSAAKVTEGEGSNGAGFSFGGELLSSRVALSSPSTSSRGVVLGEGSSPSSLSLFSRGRVPSAFDGVWVYISAATCCAIVSLVTPEVRMEAESRRGQSTTSEQSSLPKASAFRAIPEVPRAGVPGERREGKRGRGEYDEREGLNRLCCCLICF